MIFILLVFSAIIWAEDEPAEAQKDQLVRMGFENIVFCSPSSDRLQVFYENRIYRHDVKAAGEVLRVVITDNSPLREVELIPCEYGIAICSISIDVVSYLKFRRGEWRAEEFVPTISVREVPRIPDESRHRRRNSSFYKIDATINIGNQIVLGQYDDRLKIYGQLQPGLSTHLWRGNRVFAEAAVPFYNEMMAYDQGARLGRLGISQVMRLPSNTYAAIHGGVFTPDRWGGSMEIGTFQLNRQILAGAQWDYTGFFYHEKGTWFYSPLHVQTFKFYLQCYLPWLDGMVGIDWSRYLLGDEGWRMVFRRTFSETDVDVYFTITDLDKHGGVQLRIPLPTSKRMRPGRFRITWPEQYRVGYRASNKVYTLGPALQTGLIVNTGFSLSDYLKSFSWTHLIHNVKSWK
jgi:hypothetical protein